MAIFWGSPEARIHAGTAAVMDDTVDYTDSTDSVHVDMAGSLSRLPGRPPIFGGYAEGDLLASIEFIWGSEFNDVLVGDGVANGLFGYVGSDRITGGAGNDTLRGEAGGDTVSGGAGNDHVYGDGDNDEVAGDAGNDAVFGGRGDDTVSGGRGHDAVWGGKQDDLLIGGLGADTLEGGLGADTIYGDTVRRDAAGVIIGPGPDVDQRVVRDVASYTLSNEGVVVALSGSYMNGTYSSSEAVSDGTASGTTLKVTLKAAAGGHAAGDVLYGITHVRGSAHGDTLVGDGEVNWLWGEAGNDLISGSTGWDTLFGGRGNDTVNGDHGNDSLVGGPGADRIDGGHASPADTVRDLQHDIVSYHDSPAGVQVNLSNATGHMGGDAAGDTLISVEDVTGSAHGDLLIGNSGRNVIRGGPGDDWDDPKTALSDTVLGPGTRTPAAKGGLFGGAEVDSIMGGAGNDLIAGEGGFDQLHGGEGNDFIHGGSQVDSMWGGAGDDTLHGGAGDDTVYGDEGNDLLIFDADRVVNGGAGIDTWTGSHRMDNLTIDLAASHVSNMENAIGGSGNDNITGNGAANVLEGRDGNDTLTGGAGNDTLLGGAGDNNLTGGAGVDRFVLAKQPNETTGNKGTTSIADWATGEKIDISALGISATTLATALRQQGTGNTRTVNFGLGNGEATVTIPSTVTGLVADDFIL